MSDSVSQVWRTCSMRMRVLGGKRLSAVCYFYRGIVVHPRPFRLLPLYGGKIYLGELSDGPYNISHFSSGYGICESSVPLKETLLFAQRLAESFDWNRKRFTPARLRDAKAAFDKVIQSEPHYAGTFTRETEND
ncbi:MAG: hypothetical protein FJX78_05965 [Armatimonadetes bacterium]|nr:hypothetical protein [Armatimonadota bacterium]